MAIIQCPECGQQLAGGERACSNCGFPLQKPTDKAKHIWRCRNCGETTDSLICPHCGKSSVEKQTSFTEPSTNLGGNEPHIGKPAQKRKKSSIIPIIGIIAAIVIAVSSIQNRSGSASGSSSDSEVKSDMYFDYYDDDTYFDYYGDSGIGSSQVKYGVFFDYYDDNGDGWVDRIYIKDSNSWSSVPTGSMSMDAAA